MGSYLHQGRYTPLVLVTCAIYLITWFITSATSNVIQATVIQQHAASQTFPVVRHFASVLFTFLLVLSCLKLFQKIHYQRLLMIVVLCVLIGLIAKSVSLQTYSFISAFGNYALNLSEAWRQLFVHPAWRSTVEGILTGLGMVVNLRAIGIEEAWMVHIEAFDRFLYILGGLLILFWYFSKNSTLAQPDAPQTTFSFKILFTSYHYLFVLTFLSGFNEGLLSFIPTIAHQVLPDKPIKYYQYAACFGGIIGPMIMGRFGDRLGILYMLFVTTGLLLLCHFLDMLLLQRSGSFIRIYYGTIFLEAAMIVCLISLTTALIGERLRTHGIFRVFALANLIASLGTTISMRLKIITADSLFTYKIMIITINIFLIGMSAILYWRMSLKKGLTSI
ncbi:hypothetical protein Lgra_1389 [Legionella gratiana]|uniref:MFS transporter n=2 Tax=Legionella gratiana TaxID=45066 RepID=A0A378JFR8_9GAMM|nr:hypothetical protein Lgra_1389 [Legionella gratiana]STX46465.1 Uncharacterised protein [Legionella gratiana]